MERAEGVKEQDLKEVLEGTLIEIRELISELENPFNLFSKYLKDLPLKEDEWNPVKGGAATGIDTDTRNSGSEPIAESAHDAGEGACEGGHGFRRAGLEGISAMLSARILNKVFDGKPIEGIVYEYYERGLIPRESMELAYKGLKLLPREPIRLEVLGDIEAHILAISLLRKLASDGNDPFFTLLLLIMDRSLDLVRYKG